MWRLFWIAASIFGALMAGLVWVSCTQATFLFKHPRTRGVRVEIDKRTGAAIVMRPISAAAKPALSPAGKLPKAVTPQKSYDFGLMDPLTMGRHEFEVRNEGDAPLKLHVGPTTCKCTVSGLAKNEVLPGETTTVSLEWNTGRNLYYEHSGIIFTNDPKRTSLELRVTGRVKTLIACDEPDISLGTLDPDRPATATKFIYSQHWQDFTIENAESQMPGLKWEVIAADPAAEPELQATAARKLRLTIPGGLPQGPFSDTLRLTIHGPDDAELQHLDVPLSGHIPRRLSFYGDAIGSEGAIELGDVAEGQGAQVRLFAKVRDVQLELPAAKVEVFPSFVAAKFEPVANRAGMYQLTLDLPSSAPAGQYLSSPIGRVKIDTGHPRIGVVELKFAFCVTPRRG